MFEHLYFFEEHYRKVLHALQQNRRCLVQGGPGIGKSAFLRFFKEKYENSPGGGKLSVELRSGWKPETLAVLLDKLNSGKRELLIIDDIPHSFAQSPEVERLLRAYKPTSQLHLLFTSLSPNGQALDLKRVQKRSAQTGGAHQINTAVVDSQGLSPFTKIWLQPWQEKAWRDSLRKTGNAKGWGEPHEIELIIELSGGHPAFLLRAIQWFSSGQSSLYKPHELSTHLMQYLHENCWEVVEGAVWWVYQLEGAAALRELNDCFLQPTSPHPVPAPLGYQNRLHYAGIIRPGQFKDGSLFALDWELSNPLFKEALPSALKKVAQVTRPEHSQSRATPTTSPTRHPPGQVRIEPDPVDPVSRGVVHGGSRPLELNGLQWQVLSALRAEKKPLLVARLLPLITGTDSKCSVLGAIYQLQTKLELCGLSGLVFNKKRKGYGYDHRMEC